MDERHRELAEQFFAAHDPAGRRILHVQCGNGWLRDHLEKAHPAFVSFLGIDTRDDQITTARMRRPDLTRDFACRDLRSQPLPNDSFDLVIALDGGPPLSELAKIATVAACGRSADGIKIA